MDTQDRNASFRRLQRRYELTLTAVAATAILILGVFAASALAITPATPTRATASVLDEPLFVNMRDAGSYRLGRYVNGQPNPSGAVAASACGTWSPSAVRALGTVYLYAAECSGLIRGTSWRSIVRYTSTDGGRSFHDREVVAVFGLNQIRMPTVIYDRGRFHLWYTQDQGDRIGRRLMYASSRDGLHFGAARVKFRAGRLTTINVSTVFRFKRRGWRMVIGGYSPDLSRAWPYVLGFRSPGQRRYRYRTRMRTARLTPKLDGSFVCRTSEGWEGLFVVYGDRLGRERTMHFAAPNLRGPWRLVSDPEIPVLSFANGEAMMHSVENPTRLASSARLPFCFNR